MHNVFMTSTLTLQNGALRCELAPALGGCIAGLWWGQQEVLRSSPAAALGSALASASYPLVPYSNRIGQRILHWAGKSYTLAENFAPEPHSIHGVGWERAWQVDTASTTLAVLSYSHQPDASWPFAFDSRQTITVSEHTLQLHMSITNRASEATPVGLGWHPYFAKSPQTRIAFDAAGSWDMDADKLPSVRRDHSGLKTDCTSLDVDHCFDGWSGGLLLVEGGLRVRLTSDLRYLVVFTTPGRYSIAIEPVSHVNNASGLAHQTSQPPQSLGLRVLQPGETFSASMQIEVEAAA
jgi:aldose 1-epimerase